MMSTHDAMVRDSLDFPNLIKLSDVRQNFKYELEIYGMVGFHRLKIDFFLWEQGENNGVYKNIW